MLILISWVFFYTFFQISRKYTHKTVPQSYLEFLEVTDMEEKTTRIAVSETEFQRIANRVSVVTIIGNVALSLVKLLAGIIAHSGAMISDAVHSASDVFSTFVVIIGIRLASKEPDKEHPYGHERMECVAAIIIPSA